MKMRKIILLTTLVISIMAMIGITLSISYIGEMLSHIFLGGISFDSSVLLELFETDLVTAFSAVGFLLWVILQIYGIPLIIFLVSLNGLTQK
jgi:hypothetical protein